MISRLYVSPSYASDIIFHLDHKVLSESLECDSHTRRRQTERDGLWTCADLHAMTERKVLLANVVDRRYRSKGSGFEIEGVAIPAIDQP